MSETTTSTALPDAGSKRTSPAGSQMVTSSPESVYVRAAGAGAACAGAARAGTRASAPIRMAEQSVMGHLSLQKGTEGSRARPGAFARVNRHGTVDGSRALRVASGPADKCPPRWSVARPRTGFAARPDRPVDSNLEALPPVQSGAMSATLTWHPTLTLDQSALPQSLETSDAVLAARGDA